MEVVAVIPVKSLNDAKSRLAPHLTDAQRRRLVAAMLRQVIRAAQAASAEVWVLGADDSTRPVALAEDTGWRQEAGANINESLFLAFEEVWAAGKSPLFLPGDLPFLQPEDLIDLISTAGDYPSVGSVREPTLRSQITLSPARNGGGTNGVFIPHPLPFRFQLGPDSFSRHLREACIHGLKPRIHASPGLARDLDTWEDLREYEAQQPGFLAPPDRRGLMS